MLFINYTGNTKKRIKSYIFFLDAPVNQVPSQPVPNTQQPNGAQLQYPGASQGQPQGFAYPPNNPGQITGDHQQYPMQPQGYNPGQMAGGQQPYPMQPLRLSKSYKSV